MCKLEVLPQAIGEPKAIKKGRGIQFTVNEATAYDLGPEQWAFGKALAHSTTAPYEIGGVKFTTVYTACMSHEAIGEFATESEALRKRYGYSVIDERDGKNWDANVQVPHRHAVIQLYETVDKKLAQKARDDVSVEGRYFDRDNDVKIKYTIVGTVKSGHWDTSSGNAALNIDVSVSAILKLPSHLRPKEVRALVMGDDYMAWLYYDRLIDPKELKPALDAAEAELGISPVRGLFSDIRNASFISLGFYIAINGQVVPLPKAGRMFAKLFWTVTDLRGRDPRALASGVAEAFLPLYSGWPAMRQFLSYHTQVDAVEAHNVFYDWKEMGIKRLPSPIDFAANHLVKYGCDALLIDLSDLLVGPQRAALVHHPVITRMYCQDVSDPGDRIGCIS